MIRLLLCRHGQSTADLEPRCIEGSGDFPLTGLGLRQAGALATRIAARHRLDRIYTSPLLRAEQTARQVATATGAPLERVQALAEGASGMLAGLLPEEADRLYPVEHPVPVYHRPPGGESYIDLYRRAVDFWYRLYLSQEANGQTLLLVTHGGTMQALVGAALGLPLLTHAGFVTADTGLHELHVVPGGKVRVVRLNDTAHLEGLV